MKHENYIEIIDKTAVYPQTVDNFGKAYCFFGLTGEWQEMLIDYKKVIYGSGATLEENIKALGKEIGDVIWYITCACKEFGSISALECLDIISNQEASPYYSNSEEILEMANNVPFATLSEPLKKFYRDGKPIEADLINNLLNTCCKYLGEIISEEEGLDLDQILKNNYEKLMKRRTTGTLHGDGSNREEATNA